ncbi:MAG: efflux RND transporter periplasmic adaptor subunit [Caulobacterales bacterium]
MAAPRRRRWGFAMLGVALVALLAWAVISHLPAPKKPTPPPAAVYVARVAVQDLPVSITELGAAQAWQGVTIRAQVSGKLLRADFREGADVAKGQLLAEIDAAPFRAVLMQAQGALARDRALLQQARVDLARYNALLAEDSIAAQTRDVQAALVQQDEGLVRIDEGAVAAAEVNVRYCRITSPLAGRIGVRLVDPGNLVSASDTTGIVTVNQISPIAVVFTVPQDDYQRLSDVSDGFTRPMTTQALSQDSGAVLGEGELSIADNHVDQTTGTVQLKARFPNDTRRLLPGQFVNVKLTLQTLQHATTIPAAAVNQGPRGAYAYVVGPGSKVAMRPIAIAQVQDGVAVVKSGLSPGETVVTDGQMSLRPGAPVSVRQPGGARKPGP